MVEEEFTLDNIKDQKGLYQKVLEETISIWESPNANKGRTFCQVWESVFKGKVAEAWMVQEIEGMEWTPQRWHDLVDKNGDLVEVKTVNSKSGVKPVLEKLRSPSTQIWNHSKWVWFFETNGSKWKHIVTEAVINS